MILKKKKNFLNILKKKLLVSTVLQHRSSIVKKEVGGFGGFLKWGLKVFFLFWLNLISFVFNLLFLEKIDDSFSPDDNDRKSWSQTKKDKYNNFKVRYILIIFFGYLIIFLYFLNKTFLKGLYFTLSYNFLSSGVFLILKKLLF